MKENELKKLNTELRVLRNYEQSLTEKRKVLQNNINSNVSECKTVKINIKSKESEIKKLTNSKNTIISEHAILRYLDRVCGMDIENVKRLILNDEFKTLNSLSRGDGTISIGKFKYILKDNVIITIK